MAWTTPPTFTTGNVLTAAQLNILSDDIEVLYGYKSGISPGMVATTITNNGDIFLLIQHLHRYLHCRVRATDDVEIFYDANSVFHDGSPDGDEVYDIDLDAEGLTIGQFYTLKFTLSGADNRTVYYAYENESAT